MGRLYANRAQCLLKLASEAPRTLTRGKLLPLSTNENYYTNAFILLVRRIFVVTFYALHPNPRSMMARLYANRAQCLLKLASEAPRKLTREKLLPLSANELLPPFLVRRIFIVIFYALRPNPRSTMHRLYANRAQSLLKFASEAPRTLTRGKSLTLSGDENYYANASY